MATRSVELQDAPSKARGVSKEDIIDMLVPTWASFDIAAGINGLIPRVKLQIYSNRLVHVISSWLRTSSKIELLPTEILIEIILYLELQDILSLPRTCRRLASICHARPIWTSLFCEYRQLFGLPWNAPIEKYTTDALEAMVRRRLRAEVGWRNDEVPKERSIPSPYEGYGNAALVPGGRWLLQVSDCALGSVFAYDLDAEHVVAPRLIIEPEDASEMQSLYYIAVDVDHSEPLLTFNLCVFPQFFYGRPSQSGEEEPIPSVQVYRVSCTGHSENSVPKARKLTSFVLSSIGHWRNVFFNGPYIARYLLNRATHDNRVEVYDWTRSNGVKHFKTFVFCSDYSLNALTLLPEHRLLCLFHDRLALYSITNLTSLFDGQIKDAAGLELIWTQHEMDGETFTSTEWISAPLVGQQFLRVSFPTLEKICGLTIHHVTNKLELVEISDFCPSADCIAIGIHRLVAHVGTGTVLSVNLHWPDFKDFRHLGVSRDKEHEVSAPAKSFPFIDEITGRVVLSCRNKWIILDFGNSEQA